MFYVLFTYKYFYEISTSRVYFDKLGMFWKIRNEATVP